MSVAKNACILPTDAPPGSAAKMAILADRVKNRLPLHLPGDKRIEHEKKVWRRLYRSLSFRDLISDDASPGFENAIRVIEDG